MTVIKTFEILEAIAATTRFGILNEIRLAVRDDATLSAEAKATIYATIRERENAIAHSYAVNLKS